MRKTKWMVLCLFMGFLMAAGMMSTVPIYMDASLQRMLIKDMESYQLSTGDYPGIYSVKKTVLESASLAERLKLSDELPEKVRERVSDIAMPIASGKTVVNDNLQYISVGGNKGAKSIRIKITAMTGFKEHINIVDGRMYCDGAVAEDGAYEVVISEAASKALGVVLGNTYDIRGADAGRNESRLRIVGIYEPSDPKDVYWSETMDGYISSVMTDFDCFKENMLKKGVVKMTDIAARYALSYQQMDMNNIDKVVSYIKEDFGYFKELGYDFEMGIFDILKNYSEEAEQLTQMLWVLQIPAMVMLAFYLFMVSRLNVEQEKNEIAVYKSRGASSAQIFGMYAAEAGILGLATLFIAPFLGLLLCRFLGVSNGFLEFVNRTGISAKITMNAVLYALLAVIAFFAATIIPVIPASKLSIVEYKQSKTKVVKMQLWEKCGIDFLLIAAAAAFYCIYTANETADTLSTGEINPLFFIFAACLTFGLGLLFIRVYPYILNLLYLAFRPLWSPSQYMAITSVCRSQNGKERFLMMFLIVTFSLGIFSANTARTINTQKEDRIYYSIGADVALKEYWQEVTANDGSDSVSGYVERDFERFENLEGVETATKVLINENAKVSVGKKTESYVTLMAVEPYKFSDVAWFRNDLLPVHWYNYLKALQDCPSGIILSRPLADKYEIELGDLVSVKWSGNEAISAPVLAVVDYWPGINPNEPQKKSDKKNETEEAVTPTGPNEYAQKSFAIMNYYYTSTVSDMEPYEVWLKLKDGATSEALYNDISAKRIPIEIIKDASQRIISIKNQPRLQGMNGALTLSFVIIMIMTVIGFLIYWILSIRSRTLQFGILRAMGVTFREIIGIIGYEQLLVSGVSIAMAFVIGGVVSDLFVPLFRSMYNPAEQVPPFLVCASQSDFIKIYAIIVIMLVGGFAILGRLIKKININKALKLGED